MGVGGGLKAAVLFLVALLLPTGAAVSAAVSPAAQDAIAASRAAVGGVAADRKFTDTHGRTVRLSDFAGKPVVVNLVYTGCADVCPTVVETLGDSLKSAVEAFGEDAFVAITVGFDVRNDNAGRMRIYRAQHGRNLANWHFLSGSSADVDGLAEDIGFVFVPSAQGFDHMAQTTLLDGERRIVGHIYGGAFPPVAVAEPLKDLIFGRKANFTSFDGLMNRVLLYCTLYNARTGRYEFDWSIFIGIAIGLLTLSSIAVVLVRAVLDLRRRSARRAGAV